MSEKKAASSQRILAGLLFMCGAGLLFPAMSGFAKFLGADYNTLQISRARAFGHIVFMLIFFVPRFGLGMLCTRRPGTQLMRSLMLFTSNAASFLAIGFTGVLILIQPGTGLFHWASLLSLLGAACYAIYQVLTRLIAGIDTPGTSAIYGPMVGGFGMFLVLPFIWKTPHDLHDIFYFCSLGVLGGLGHYFVARALAHAPANIVAPASTSAGRSASPPNRATNPP